MLRTSKLIDATEFQRRPMKPFGLVLQANSWARNLARIPVVQLRELARRYGVLVLRDFKPFDKEGLADYAAIWGDILTWNFGSVLDLVVHDEPKNYLFTNGSVPLHWDGAFAQQVPSFLLFQCLQAPRPGSGGETLFSHTPAVWRSAPAEQRRRWQDVRLTYVTEKVAHYGGRITAPLTARHPVTGATTLRFSEPPNAQTADLNPLLVESPGMSSEELAWLLRELTAALYQPRHCYAHAWKEGDILIADNHALLHGRRSFRSHSPRHLRRVHIL